MRVLMGGLEEAPHGTGETFQSIAMLTELLANMSSA